MSEDAEDEELKGTPENIYRYIFFLLDSFIRFRLSENIGAGEGRRSTPKKDMVKDVNVVRLVSGVVEW